MSNMTEKDKEKFLNQVDDITSKIYEITEQAYQKNNLIDKLQKTILSQKTQIIDLEKQIEEQKFNEDNYNRFSVIKQQSRELRDKDILIQKLERENRKLNEKIAPKKVNIDTITNVADKNAIINDNIIDDNDNIEDKNEGANEDTNLDINGDTNGDDGENNDETEEKKKKTDTKNDSVKKKKKKKDAHEKNKKKTKNKSSTTS